MAAEFIFIDREEVLVANKPLAEKRAQGAGRRAEKAQEEERLVHKKKVEVAVAK